LTRSSRAILAAAALSLLAPTQTEAQYKFEESLMHMLPQYCRYTQQLREHMRGDNREEIARWTTVMGSTFVHLHHYCFGLMDTNRAVLLAQSREDRLLNLNNSIKEYDYVIDRAPIDFTLLPEILTRKGESLIHLDRPGEAMLEFQRAIKIQADYAPAYAAASDFYKRTGQLAKAREWLEKGLSAAPNAGALKRRMAELDRQKAKSGTVPGSTRKQAAPSD
jgi:tetratricopeptide (TPR) repeat protein